MGSPGAAARHGLSYQVLSSRHPTLIVRAISGYGDQLDAPGPYTNILAALLQRGRTGHGKRIDISMLESMVEWMAYPLYDACDEALFPERAGAAHATIYPYGSFTAGDGKSVVLGVQNERERDAFCSCILQRPRLSSDPQFDSNSRRSENREALHALIVEAFSTLTAEEVLERLDGAQIANARINSIHEVWHHEQLQARGRWTQVDSPVGKIPALLPPGVPSVDHAKMQAVPDVGEHTEAILNELEYDADGIHALREAGAI